ncbi:MAG: hypothetical protein O7E52_00635 [Candidatus Poribacteria bacterium]|nr:hypothetical protein [Candidatus Poribacteria bacterium]
MKIRRKMIVVLLMCCGLSLFFFSLQHNSAYTPGDESKNRPGPDRQDERQMKEQSDQNHRKPPRERARQERDGRDDESGKPTDFYRSVVDNNLFRPLGWRKPNREPAYVLIGTWIQSDGEIAKALVMERKSNQLYYVSTGEKVGKATIEKIEATQVSLNTSGKIITLKADSMQFLSGTPSAGDESPKGGTPETAGKGPRKKKRLDRKPENREGNGQNWGQIRDKFRNATPAERRGMIQEFRRRGGGSGRRGGDGGRRVIRRR